MNNELLEELYLKFKDNFKQYLIIYKQDERYTINSYTISGEVLTVNIKKKPQRKSEGSFLDYTLYLSIDGVKNILKKINYLLLD